jgi:hypothetical protein
MMNGGRGHRRSPDFAVRGEHLFDGAKSAAAELSCDGVGPGEIGINHAHQPNRFSLLIEFTVDSGVIASEDAHTDDCDGDRIVRLQEKTLGWPVATRNKEQRTTNNRL